MRKGERNDDERNDALSGVLVLLFAVACGAMVANLYYAQTLIARIGPDIGLSPRMGGTITMLTQLGYGAGLALLVPLGDLFENRRLALIATAGAVVACLGVGVAQGPASFLAASFATGVFASGAQVLLPLATHLTPHDRQGRVIGRIMAGLLTGIMLSRPAASFCATWLGWRAIFFLSAALIAVVWLALVARCPRRMPAAGLRYGAILRSTVAQLGRYRTLRMRALYQALLFAAFNLFWTAAPLALFDRFGFDDRKVALFALAGAAGALAAPVAGALADRGFSWWTTLGALALLGIGFALSLPAVAATAIIAFVAAAILIDAAVQLNQITGQKLIFALSQEARGRVNAAYMTVMFVIGATGSLIGTATYAEGGWRLSAISGAAIGVAALILFLVADRGASRDG